MRNNLIGLSHINVVVDDINSASSFYERALGFETAIDKEGQIMDYPNVTLESFARNAGFGNRKVDVNVRFLKHQQTGIYLELMQYNSPKGSSNTEKKNTNDIGGIRHIAFEVKDIKKAFDHIKNLPGAFMINESKEYGPPEELTPFPIKFFYWIDKYGVQWEFEEGRAIGQLKGIV